MISAEEMLSAIAQVVKVLGPMESEDRHRVIQASLVVLKEKPAETSDASSNAVNDTGETANIPAKARTWLKQNSLSPSQLELIFDLSAGTAEVIAAEVPGKSNEEKTINSYVLAGLAGLLATGDAAFEDKAARSLCSAFGCYDVNNHSTHLKGKGNKFTGSKDQGWRLTAPGLKFGAALINQMSDNQG